MPTPYTDEEHSKDKERILQALDALQKLQETYADVIAIPEVVTLHDITSYRLDDYRGAKRFETMFDRAHAVAVLKYFAGQDLISPEHFEHTIICALQEVKPANNNNRSK
jgi:hypothetical protein